MRGLDPRIQLLFVVGKDARVTPVHYGNFIKKSAENWEICDFYLTVTVSYFYQFVRFEFTL